MPKPVVLCILDGWGLGDGGPGDAPALARTPVMDRLMATCPHATLTTFGPDVGLPTGQMGNSEVGHTNIGAGRVVAMDLGQIDLAIEDGSFAENEGLGAFIAALKASGGTAHLAGLVSPGGVHSHQSHMIAAARAIAAAGVPVAIHALTDGRDVAPKSADGYIAETEKALPEGARFVTVSGRYYAMDRDNRWDRVSKAYEAILHGKGEAGESATGTVTAAYAADKTDEFILPTVLPGYAGMTDGDGLFFLNFRADRAREILRAIGEPGFAEFDPGTRPRLAALLGMVEYSEGHNAYMTTCFPPRDIRNTLGAWVARHGLTQFHIAETEKYPHVTFFLNGGKEDPEPGEDRYMPKSPDVATYDMKPEMSAPEVSERLVAAIEKGYDFIVVNFANPDMVGHTGVIEAAVAACEAVDTGLGKALDALEKAGGAIIVTADHGNCDMMIDPETGGPHTAHTLNPVPVVIYGAPEGARVAEGRLADLAPTVLELMGLPQPEEMTGKSLLR
ncbi:2,3-bisphosphoglycerate-independent phosphoglycerate mutase [Vannielia litorea]|uniref:2,3-bisphosphoglycerate-independent phosphoglycerate mutase n=1 Tax=Vannielia litorea TaxID=1217970 RepID=A0A1N6II29_9RHOB|nr:2,3-bisphosphoglycerate-independent phosphoglycerate mutase [Vannielia litorea]SIO31666.1 phosphoglycerate mutase [Vannielia litorea]